MSRPVAFFADGELAALEVIRQCVDEQYDDKGHSQEIYDEILLPLFQQHGPEGLLALVVEVGRHAQVNMFARLAYQHGRRPSQDQMHAELDRLEMLKIQDPPKAPE
jgi:hypothetical protein